MVDILNLVGDLVIQAAPSEKGKGSADKSYFETYHGKAGKSKASNCAQIFEDTGYHRCQTIIAIIIIKVGRNG